MITKTITVTQYVDVTIDETKLTSEWMESFRGMFYPYYDVDDHLKHLAQLEARGITYQPHVSNTFIEGYGSAAEMGHPVLKAGDQMTKHLEQRFYREGCKVMDREPGSRSPVFCTARSNHAAEMIQRALNNWTALGPTKTPKMTAKELKTSRSCGD